MVLYGDNNLMLITGFAAVESGMARSKNAVNILSKNFIVFAVSSRFTRRLGVDVRRGQSDHWHEESLYP